MVQPRGRVQVPPPGIYLTVSQILKPPPGGRKLTAGCPTPTSTPLQIDWNQKVNDVDIHFPPHQPFRTMFMS